RNGGRKRDERRRHRRRIWRRVLSAEPPERADGGGGASGGKDQASVRIDWTNRLACSTHLARSSRERVLACGRPITPGCSAASAASATSQAPIPRAVPLSACTASRQACSLPARCNRSR